MFLVVAGWLLMASWAGAVQFSSKRTELPAGATRVIPIQLPVAAKETTEIKVHAVPDGIIEIIRAPVALAGERIAYLRARGLKPGEARLEADGAKLDVRVVPGLVSDATLFAPNIISPVNGACVWGSIAVGVEFPASTTSVSLQLPTGEKLAPQKQSSDDGPVRLGFFQLDTAKLSPGPIRLVAVTEQPGGRAQTSEPLFLHVVRPGESQLVAGECEAALNSIRPERFGKAPPKVGSRPDASGGSFVLNYAATPALCLAFEAKEAGQYQVTIVARGDPAMGVFPSVGVYVDNANEAVTASRLCDREWHRTPVGRPVRVEAGKHTLTVYFMNDFHIPNAVDRNLYLDRYEIARVDVAGAGSESASMMTMAMMSAQPGGDAASPGAVGDLLVAFQRPWQELPVTGRLGIEGYCAWANPDKTPPPRVTLLVNGRPVQTQQAAEPLFWLDRAALREGTNTLQLTATQPSGETASTPLQTIRVPGAIMKDDKPRAFYRFTMQDDGWDGPTRKLLTDRDQAKGHKVAFLATNGQMMLQLPEDLAGNFDVLIEGRGEDFKGPPKAGIKLKTASEEKSVGEADVSGWWNNRKVGTVSLTPGPKQFVVSFTNDFHEEKVGDRNLWLKSVILHESVSHLDRTAPRVSLLYPKEKHAVFGADAVVAEAYDDQVLSWADLVVDGTPLGMNLSSPTGVGRFVFPLLTRALTPGPHRLRVIVQDNAGNTGESEEIAFTIGDQPPRELSPYARAVRLLQRFGFGPEPNELAAALTMGEKAWLADRLAKSFDDPGEQAASEFARARFSDGMSEYHVTRRVAQELLLTPNPIRARFVHWTENHFSTWIRKAEPRAEWDEHLRFTQLGAAPFPELLLASATSPAMLVYLDQNRSVASGLNENYARELMELHTLGVHGGYTQRDVTELARLLTGWTTADEADESGRGQPLTRVFRFDPALNDGTERHILGTTLAACPPPQRYDRIRHALEILASHPSTAKFICRKLADHYVSPAASDAMVNDLARVFLESGGDTRAVLLAISSHAEFWKPDLSPRLGTPLDYGVSVFRVCGDANPWAVSDFLQRSGMGLYDHAMPNGYPDEDQAWADSNALMQRWRFALQVKWTLNRLVPDPWRGQGEREAGPWRQQVVDVVAQRLTGRLLSDSSNQAALDALAAAKGKPWEQTLQLATFVAQLPEANLR